jgi:phosphonate transport system permease protein
VTTCAAEVRALRRAAPTSWFLRGTALALFAGTVAAWLSGEIQTADLFTGRRWDNLVRFVTVEAVPFPLREQGAGLGDLWGWIASVWTERGAEATLATLWIAVAAIVLSALWSLPLAAWAARTLATREPYRLGAGTRRGPWRLLSGGARMVCIFMRAIPEYVLAFFLVQLLPYSAWPAVLALAIHNGGILGRLYGDTLENLPPTPLRALRMVGASRRSLAVVAAIPMALPRFLLYFFYRFETCVREATVLGMLGIASLGHEVVEVRARHFYDELLLLVAFGVGIVLAGDLASYLARGWVRRAR